MSVLYCCMSVLRSKTSLFRGLGTRPWQITVHQLHLQMKLTRIPPSEPTYKARVWNESMIWIVFDKVPIIRASQEASISVLNLRNGGKARRVRMVYRTRKFPQMTTATALTAPWLHLAHSSETAGHESNTVSFFDVISVLPSVDCTHMFCKDIVTRYAFLPLKSGRDSVIDVWMYETLWVDDCYNPWVPAISDCDRPTLITPISEYLEVLTVIFTSKPRGQDGPYQTTHGL